jgi:histidinol dehydrogenase
MKFSNVIDVSRPGLKRLARHVRELARAEGLFAHEKSVMIRGEAR